MTTLTLSTVVAPVFFDGFPVSLPVKGAAPNELHAGVLTASNLAQIIYLALGICVVVFLARSRCSTSVREPTPRPTACSSTPSVPESVWGRTGRRRSSRGC